jgi:hypothetical protein
VYNEEGRLSVKHNVFLFNLLLYFCDRVILLLDWTAAANGPLFIPHVVEQLRWHCQRISKVLADKPGPVLLCLSQILHALFWA